MRRYRSDRVGVVCHKERWLRLEFTATVSKKYSQVVVCIKFSNVSVAISVNVGSYNLYAALPASEAWARLIKELVIAGSGRNRDDQTCGDNSCLPQSRSD